MNKKKILVSLSIICIFILTFIIYNYINNDGVVIASGKSEEYVNNRTFSLMLETSKGSGEYQMSSETTWPNSDYEYNGTLSSCENGSQLIWNEDTRTVTLKANISDKCYLYFDYNPKPTVTLATNNTDNTFNLSTPATLSCSNATATYNQKYQRVQVSQISSKPGNCTLTYQAPSSITYLNDYIIGLLGTTQGIGEVVHEISSVPDYTLTTVLNEGQYGTPKTYSNSSSSQTYGTTTSGTFTFSNNNWTGVPSAMTSGRYYHIRVTPQTEGYYQICYDVSTGNSSNRLYAYVNTTNQNLGGNYVTASTSTAQRGCQELGYLSTSDTVRVVQYASSNSSYGIATMSFRLEKANGANEIDTGYRYEGKNPNNYIWFNNELWRIIGVFDESSHGVSEQNLVKIIRNNSIGGITWDKNNTNDWTQASLMNLLNGAYLNSEDGTGGEYCFSSTSVPSNCDYTEIGINDTYRAMIENVRWYLGGRYIQNVTTDIFYTAERGTTVYSENAIYWDGKIGLMYPSDYGYSVLSNSCARSTNLDNYDSSTCAGENWLYGQGYEWTITPDSSYSNYACYVSFYNNLVDNDYSASVSNGYVVRPSLYLDSNVYVIDGNGSESDPYIIGM